MLLAPFFGVTTLLIFDHALLVELADIARLDVGQSPGGETKQDHALLVELADTLDLGSSAERRGGSSPSQGTK